MRLRTCSASRRMNATAVERPCGQTSGFGADRPNNAGADGGAPPRFPTDQGVTAHFRDRRTFQFHRGRNPFASNPGSRLGEGFDRLFHPIAAHSESHRERNSPSFNSGSRLGERLDRLFRQIVLFHETRSQLFHSCVTSRLRQAFSAIIRVGRDGFRPIRSAASSRQSMHLPLGHDWASLPPRGNSLAISDIPERWKRSRSRSTSERPGNAWRIRQEADGPCRKIRKAGCGTGLKCRIDRWAFDFSGEFAIECRKRRWSRK